MKAVVSRILVVTSAPHLCEILVKEGLSTNQLFFKIIDITREFLNGCQCVSDPNYHLMMDEYKKLSKDQKIIHLLTTSIKCSDVIFE